MKKVEMRKLLFLFVLPFTVFAAADRTIKTEIITSDKANQNITITPTGTGDVVLKAYNGFLKWTSGVPAEQASISLTTDVSGTLPIASGGTNSATALNNDRVMISSTGSIVESAVTTTTLGYLDATSSIQTQIDGKINDVITTQGDLIIGNGSNEESRLAIGANTYVLQSNGTTASWVDLTSSFADLASAQTIGGVKTFSSDSNWTSTGAIDIPAGTTAQQPGTPSSGMIRFNTDNAQFEGYDGSAWGELGGGGAGGVNYNDNYDIEANATGYTAFDDVSAYVDGTGGSPTVTVARNTTTPLRGDGDLKFTKTSGADYQYEGFSFDISIDKADQAKVMILDFDLDATDADCVDDALIIRIYDKTNATIIRGNGEEIKCGDLHHYMRFQTAPDSTEYRISFMYNATDTNEVIYYFDNIKVGPQVIQHGAIVTKWESFTPSYTNFTLGNGSEYDWEWRRNGSMMEIRGTTSLGGTSSVTGTLYIDIPNGLSAVPTTNTTFVTGTVYLYDSSVASQRQYGTARITSGDTKFSLASNQQLVTTTIPFTWTSGDFFSVDIAIKIAGWEENAKMSSDYSSRDIVFEAYGNDGDAITALTEDIPWKTILKDTTNSWSNAGNTGNDTNDAFTVPETGYYDFDIGVRTTANTQQRMTMYIDGTISSYYKIATASYTIQNYVFNSVPLTKGQVITFRSDNSPTLLNDSGYHRIRIVKRKSPQTMLESEQVVFIARDDSGQSAASNPLTWNTVEKDTHNAYSAGVYTCPETMSLRISAHTLTDSVAWTAANATQIGLELNGIVKDISQMRIHASLTTQIPTDFQSVVECNKGDTIELYMTSSQTVNLRSADDYYNRITITRIK